MLFQKKKYIKRTPLKKLKNLKHSNPRRYWQILNGKRKNKVEAEAESLFNFFKDINFDISSNNETSSNLPPNETCNEQINASFSEEIKKAINKWKIIKPAELTLILNEHLKTLSHIISHALVNLFNLIFDTGIFPEIWTLGMINPIYNQKSYNNVKTCDNGRCYWIGI